MKKATTITVVLFVVLQMTAQKNNIFTKSVQINEFIPFVVNNYPMAIDSLKTRNITFLIPTDGSNDITENSILLKQGFRMLSKRLSDKDNITIIAYNESNGEVLKPTSPKEIKTILYALNNIEKNISVKIEDGIQLAYDTADANFDENAINTIVMIRDIKGSSKSIKKIKYKKERRPRSNAILLTLISLAPEVIRVLKE